MGIPAPFVASSSFHSSMNLTPGTLQRIDEVITHYPSKRSASLPLLHLVQEELGYISDEAIEWIAAKLELEPINVYELVTFYPMFRRQPIGRRHIKVCRTLSCALMGGYGTCAEFKKQFGCELGETSADGEATIEFVECLASCGTAPVVMIDEELYEKVDAAKARELSAKIKAEPLTPAAHR
jgi:NADH-quinone oxidoreductase subunit E